MATEHVYRKGSGITTSEATVAINYQRSTLIAEEEAQWIKEGRVFSAIEGVLTTPVAGAAADLVRQTPNFLVRVPASIVIVPLTVIWVPEATTAVAQMLISSCNNDPGVANMVAVTPVNVNTRFAATNSQVLAYGTNTGATGTAPTGVADLYREYHQADRDAITGAPTPPLIYSPKSGNGQECVIGDNISVQALLVYGLTGTTGTNTNFFIVTWAEFTYDEYYG